MTTLTTREQFSSYAKHGFFKEKKRLILKEAARLFVQKGVHETSLNELAALFDISKPALYHYVKSKDEIIEGILETARADNKKLLKSIESLDATGLERFRATLTFYARSMGSDFGRCLATMQPSTFSGKTQALHRKTHRMLLEGLTAIVQGGIEDGSIGPCNPRIVVFAAVGALNSMARWFDPNGPLTAEDVAEEMIRALFDGIAAK